jgi:predicted enzyme related to lactoylglutathione lyase
MVDDTTMARQFYADLFGWEIQDGPPEAGGYLMALKSGRAAAGIAAKMPGQEGLPSAWTTYLAADSADDIATRVADAGGQVLLAPFDVLDVGRMAVAADPTGAAFGVWQAGSHTGAGIFNEDGAYCWNELHTRDYDAAKAFYAAVYGYTYTELGDGETMSYSTFTLPGATESCGGINDDTKFPGELPAYWLAWFQVDDCDATTAKAAELGATVMMGPDATPFGRMTVLQGPQGEVFGVIDPTRTTAGEAGAPES